MDSIEQKIVSLKNRFHPLSMEERYAALIELGSSLPPYPTERKKPDYLVTGCQSHFYLYAILENSGRLHFYADSDALISKGLGALLLFVYNVETPKNILSTPPSFLLELDLVAALTPSRSNGLARIHQRINEEALKALPSS